MQLSATVSQRRRTVLVLITIATFFGALLYLQVAARAAANITYDQISQAELAMLTGRPGTNLTKEQLARSEGITETDVSKTVVQVDAGMVVEYWADIYFNETPGTVEDVALGRVMQPAISAPLMSTTIHNVPPGTGASLLFLRTSGDTPTVGADAGTTMRLVSAISAGERSVRHVWPAALDEFAAIAHWGMGPEVVTFRYNEPIPIYTMNGLRRTEGPAVFSSYRADKPNVQAQLHHVHVVVYVMVTK